jgi:hypothetical protein
MNRISICIDSNMLHTYKDGSILKVITSRELVSIPIWKGQRTLNKEHSLKIKEAVGSDIASLDSGYSIVNYKEENADGNIVLSSYLIDGQHRASVIRDYYASTVCEPDFDVTVTEKTVESESDAVEYFNKINNTKPQQWKVDPNLLINAYITAIEKKYNTNKKCLLIRPDSTARPYLSAAALRESFILNKQLLKSSKEEIIKFIERVDKFNNTNITKFTLEMTQPNVKDIKLKERAVSINFTLAYDTKLQWIKNLL